MRPMRILLADDHPVVRRGVRALLASNPKWKICGEVFSGKDAVAKAAQLNPDVVVLDIYLPDLNGLEATRQILRAAPRTKVLIFTTDSSEPIVREGLNAGARGYVLKSDADRDLLAALEALGHDQAFFTSKVSQMVLEGYLRGGAASGDDHSRDPLTPRQREVVRLLADGKSNKEVASALGISVKTAETHRNNIMQKLELRSFSELVRYAVLHRIVEA